MLSLSAPISSAQIYSIISASGVDVKEIATAQRIEDVRRVASSLAAAVRSAAAAQHLNITTSISENAAAGEIDINVGNLRRESLICLTGSGRTGGGVDDIVKHFVQGWHARRTATGYWHGGIWDSRKDFAGVNFIAPVLNQYRSANPDITITAPSGWE